MKLVVVALLFTCLFCVALGSGSGISSTVFSLAAYQTENGGFHSQKFEGVPGNVEETQRALFLASLFGVNDKIHIDGVRSFLDSLATSDNAFSHTPGQSSDIEAVRNAILAYAHLGALPADSSNLVSYINSLYDSSTKLFRSGPGGPADYRSTAMALETFHILGYEGSDLQSKKDEIVTKLKAAVKTEGGNSYFSLITADNYFAILSAHLAGFSFYDAGSWIDYFSSRQAQSGAKRGGFFSDNYNRDVGIPDVEYAVRSIYILKGKILVTKSDINLPALSGFLSTFPRSLGAAAHAYSALAHTTIFQETFKITPSYSVRDNRFKVTAKRIIQGTLFKPSLQVKTTYGLIHPGLTASVVIKHDNVEESIDFSFNPESQLYETTQFYDSNDKFGPVSLNYKLQWDVVGLDTLSFTLPELKSIGYDISVSPKATYGDVEVPQAGTVGFGTTFNFDVKLGTVSVPRPKLYSGDFGITFAVLDSSNVPIHSEIVDGNSNTKPFSFQYTLSSSNIPAGRLTFVFNVANQGGVHTSEDVSYNLAARMVATNIEFPAENVLKFGETFTVTMEPATLPDLRTVQKYQKGNRKFFLDLYSDSLTPLASFPGVPDATSETAKYSFSVNIPPRFDLVGDNILFFRYTDSNGQDIKLQNFNSETNELFDEGEHLKFTLNADLEVIDLEGISSSKLELEYGQRVELSFNVLDSVSGEFVYRSTPEAAVYLVLRHAEKDGSTFTSSKTRAVVATDETGSPTGLTVTWEVDPNAIKDKGQLHLVVQEADGSETPLKLKGEPWVVDVNIGGRLNIHDTTYSDEFDDFDTTFLVSFELSCDDTKLSGAQLSARVYYGSGPKRTLITTLPVGAGVEGSYQISWTLATERAHSGDYVVEIYRRVDLERSHTTDPYEGTSPFFTIHHYHEGQAVSPLPFKTEFLVLLVLLVSSVAVSMKKLQIEKANQ